MSTLKKIKKYGWLGKSAFRFLNVDFKFHQIFRFLGWVGKNRKEIISFFLNVDICSRLLSSCNLFIKLGRTLHQNTIKFRLNYILYGPTNCLLHECPSLIDN